MGMMGLFNEAAAAPASVKGVDSGDSTWTKEQDEKLIELRTDNGPWATTAAELGKKEHECKARFKQIKPADWRPGKGKGGNQKQANQKGANNQNNQKPGEARAGNKKEEMANGGNGAPTDNIWGGWGNSDDNGATQDTNNAQGVWGEATGGNDNSGSGESKSLNGSNNADQGFSADNNGWGGGGGDSGNNDAWQTTGGGDGGGGGWGGGGGESWNNDAGGWGAAPGDNGGIAWDSNNTSNDASKDANNNQGGLGFGGNNNNTNFDSNNNNAGFDGSNPTWGNFNPAPANTQAQSSPQPASPNKPSSRPPSQLDPNATKLSNPPAEYELTPDSTFSASDLRLIARILQQDCHLVWNRVSWRFKDKTGRTVHPDVFEKKVTGVVGRKGSGRGWH